MSDQEFDVLDEMYFVVSFEELQTETELSDSELLHTLKNLKGKGYIKVLASRDQEVETGRLNLDTEFKNYYYLASKKGLLAHNTGES
jgi:hypothetical protein